MVYAKLYEIYSQNTKVYMGFQGNFPIMSHKNKKEKQEKKNLFSHYYADNMNLDFPDLLQFMQFSINNIHYILFFTPLKSP